MTWLQRIREQLERGEVPSYSDVCLMLAKLEQAEELRATIEAGLRRMGDQLPVP